ncbi:MAG: hypothetical protein ACOYXT_06155 [Bacteroidota bacterium]
MEYEIGASETIELKKYYFTSLPELALYAEDDELKLQSFPFSRYKIRMSDLILTESVKGKHWLAHTVSDQKKYEPIFIAAQIQDYKQYKSIAYQFGKTLQPLYFVDGEHLHPLDVVELKAKKIATLKNDKPDYDYSWFKGDGLYYEHQSIFKIGLFFVKFDVLNLKLNG